MDDSDLKSCPFCGGPACIAHIENKYEQHRCDRRVTVRCIKCHSEGQQGYAYGNIEAVEEAKVNAIKNWNRRSVE